METRTDPDVDETAVHAECRSCGRNLTTDAEQCPTCGSGVAEYTVE